MYEQFDESQQITVFWERMIEVANTAVSARLLIDRIQGTEPPERSEPQTFELTFIKRKSC
jgi:hypothetical protein